MGTEVQPKETKVIVRGRKKVIIRRQRSRGYNLQCSMTLQKSVTRTKSRGESWIMILPWHTIIYILNALPSNILDSNRTARNQRKESRSKSQISVKLIASRMKKNDPTLPTWDALRVRLQQLMNPNCK